MKTSAPLLTLIGLALCGGALPGCHALGWYLGRSPNPIAGMRRVAVAPVLVAPPQDVSRLSEILAAELVQFDGVEQVVRPAEVSGAIESNRLSLESESDVRALAGLLKADGVLIAEITEFDPYYPPRVAVSGRLFVGDALLARRSGVIELSRAGKAQPLGRLPSGNVLSVERVFDASQREIRDQARLYALGHEFKDKAVDGSDRILWLPERYFQFVSDRLVTELFREYSRQLEAAETKSI